MVALGISPPTFSRVPSSLIWGEKYLTSACIGEPDEIHHILVGSHNVAPRVSKKITF